MHRILNVILLSATLIPVAYAQGRIYNFSLPSTGNGILYFDEIRGERLTVIDFWATWCQPCIKSLPRLVEINEEFGDRGVNFIGISVDSPRNLSKVKPFARSMGIRYPVLLDSSGELMGELNVTAVPTLLIVNNDDRIVYMHEGFTAGDEITIRKEIDRQLSVYAR